MRNRKAAALVTAVFVVLLLVISVAIMASSAIFNSFYFTNYADSVQAFYTAESGKYVARDIAYRMAYYFVSIGEEVSYFKIGITGENVWGVNNIGHFDAECEGNFGIWPYEYMILYGDPDAPYPQLVDNFYTVATGYMPDEANMRSRRTAIERLDGWPCDFTRHHSGFGSAAASTQETIPDKGTCWAYYAIDNNNVCFVVNGETFCFWSSPGWFGNCQSFWMSDGFMYGGTGDGAPWLQVTLQSTQGIPIVYSIYVHFYDSWNGCGWGNWKSLRVYVSYGCETEATHLIYSGSPSPVPEMMSFDVDPNGYGRRVGIVRLEFTPAEMWGPGPDPDNPEPHFIGYFPVSVIDMGFGQMYWGMGWQHMPCDEQINNEVYWLEQY